MGDKIIRCWRFIRIGWLITSSASTDYSYFRKLQRMRWKTCFQKMVNRTRNAKIKKDSLSITGASNSGTIFTFHENILMRLANEWCFTNVRIPSFLIHYRSFIDRLGILWLKVKLWSINACGYEYFKWAVRKACRTWVLYESIWNNDIWILCIFEFLVQTLHACQLERT